MSDAANVMTGPSEWSVLLRQTRFALSTLRADELEDLAVRAERMLKLPSECSNRHEIGDSANASHEHRLLGDLLAATDSNLQVLRRLRSRSHAPGAGLPWAR